MTEGAVLQFNDTVRLGRVAAVDTSRVLIAVENPALLPRAAVGSLCAIQGPAANQFLVGATERVTRQLREQFTEPDPIAPESLGLDVAPADALRVALLGTYYTVDGTARNRFRRGADSFPQIDRPCFLVEGQNLSRFMGLLGKDLAPEHRLELGEFALGPGVAAVADGDRFFQRHAAILGSTGSGKSCAVALILERASALRHPNLIVLDMHGEYASLADAANFGGAGRGSRIASGMRIAGPGDLDSPDASVLFLPYWLLNHEEMLSMLVDRSDQNAPNQASRFAVHVRSLKDKTLAAEGKDDVRATFTVDSPVPYDLGSLVGLLRADDTRKGSGVGGKEVKGEWEGKLTRLVSRIDAKREDRRYGFMFRPPAAALGYGWLAEQACRLLAPAEGSPGIKVVDFSEVPSDVLPVVAGVFARLLYDVQFWTERRERAPFVLVCDEAHLYLPVREDAGSVERQALQAFERIAKEGRKYGVALLVVSQRPSDVSRTILSQCNNFLVLRLTNDQDQGVVRRLMPDSLAGVLDGLPLLDTGEAVLLGDAILLPSRIKLHMPSVSPLSATTAFWAEWGERRANPGAVAAAVETLRRQSRA